MLKLADNPFCGLFPEYQAVVYGYLQSTGVLLKTLDTISLDPDRPDQDLLMHYAQFVQTVRVATPKHLASVLAHLSSNSGKATHD